MITPDLIPRMIETARKMAEAPNTYWTNQFHNADSTVGYEKIGWELLEQVAGPIHAYCCGVGTAGTLIGVSRALRSANPTTRIVALEPGSSPVISRGQAGTHHVEGIGASFVPPMLTKEVYDEARAIDESEARHMARRLAREEGIFAGVSSGLNVVAALQLAQELGPGKTVATVAVDTGLKYLAGDLFEG
jgi:cysteine synthase A